MYDGCLTKIKNYFKINISAIPANSMPGSGYGGRCCTVVVLLK